MEDRYPKRLPLARHQLPEPRPRGGLGTPPYLVFKPVRSDLETDRRSKTLQRRSKTLKAHVKKGEINYWTHNFMYGKGLEVAEGEEDLHWDGYHLDSKGYAEPDVD